MSGSQNSRRIDRRIARLNVTPVARCVAEQQRVPDVTDPIPWDHPSQPFPAEAHP